MAEILVAEHAGACYGVQRALDLVLEVANSAQGKVRTLGPLIHNPQVVAELNAKGVSVTEEVPDDPGSTLVLRTHGVTPAIEDAAHDNGLNVVDATCPYVKRVHHAVERLARDGYQVVIVGEKGHPEVEAILGHAPCAIIVASSHELEGIKLQKRVGVVVQTTQAKAILDEVVNALTNAVPEVCIINTICEATSERQTSAAALAATCDCMVVIGGRNSANTRHLAEICSASCSATHHIETPEELDASWFADAHRIGVTAGASTPTNMIDTVLSAIKDLSKE